MAFSTQRVTSDGTLDHLDLSIDYLSRDDIGVFFDNLPAPDDEWEWVGETDSTIAFTPDVPNGVEVLIQRSTKLDNLIHIFTQGAAFNNATMDEDFLQLLFLTQESVEGSGITDVFNNVDYHGNRITNLGTAIDPGDAVNLGQATAVTSAYADAAYAAAILSEKWATQTDEPVEGSLYGAKYYAETAADVLADTVQVDVNNTFTENQTFEKVAPTLALKDTSTSVTDGQALGELEFSTADATAPGVAGGVRAYADGTAGKIGVAIRAGVAGTIQTIATFRDSAIAFLKNVSITGTLNVSGVATAASFDVANADTSITRAAAGQVAVEGSRVYQRNNILGTTSQTSGVPTGAVIQRGSNGDGEYVRYADGTQICWSPAFSMTADAGSGGLFADSGSTVWTFPIAFSVPPVWHGMPVRTSGGGLLWAANLTYMPTVTSARVRVLSTVSGGVCDMYLVAIGRWF